MRTLLVLLFSALCCRAAVIEKCFTKQEYEAAAPKINKWTVEKYNDARKDLAEERQIANMHELKYDHGLEKDAKRIKTCEDFKHSYNFQIGDYYKEENQRIWSDFIQDDRRFRDYFHPLQTAFIYCELTTECDAPFRISKNNISQFPLNSTILFGYRGTFSASDIKRGPPGSQCPRAKNEKGLCIALPRSEMEKLSNGFEMEMTTKGSKIETSANENIFGLSSLIACFSAILITFLL